MINTLTYSFLAFSFLLFITISVVRLYKTFPKMGIGLVWGSLFVKMLFVITYTLAVRQYIENHIVYATFIFIAVIYSMVHTLISLKKDKYF
jgi:Ca2+/Na+ antiporter